MIQDNDQRSIRRNVPWLALILAVAVIFRIAVALYLGNEVENLPGINDQISYHTLALRLLGGHGFTFGEPWWPFTQAGEPTAHWSYLYTGFIALIYGLIGPYPVVVRLVQAVLVGLLHPFLAYKLGRIVFDERVGLIAAASTAIYAYFVYYAGALMTEPFYITAILAALYLIIRIARDDKAPAPQTALWLGLILGIAILLRQLFLLLVPVLFLWLWFVFYRQKRGLPWQATLLTGGVIVAMILPFTLYNVARFDRFVLLNTNAGFAFFWANHPIYGTQFQPILPPEMGAYQDLIPQALYGLDEAALDQALLQRGIQFVLEDPLRYARLSLSRIPPYFMFWPSADSSLISNLARVSSFGLFWPFMLAGLIQTFFRRKLGDSLIQPSFVLFLFAATYTVIHIFSWTLIRYRLPVDAVMLVFAAKTIHLLLAWLASRGFLPSGRHATTA